MWFAHVVKTDSPIDDGDVACLEGNNTRWTLGYHDSRKLWKTQGTGHQIEPHRRIGRQHQGEQGDVGRGTVSLSLNPLSGGAT